MAGSDDVTLWLALRIGPATSEFSKLSFDPSDRALRRTRPSGGQILPRRWAFLPYTVGPMRSEA